MRQRPSEDDIRTTYRATIDHLFDFVIRRCRGHRELAEDITQETWLRAVDDWERNGLPDRPAAWLARVAARLLSNHRRHEAVEQISDSDPDTLLDEEEGQLRSVAVGLFAGVSIVAVFATLMVLLSERGSAMRLFQSMFRWRYLLSLFGVSTMYYSRHRQSENETSD
ncbi:MAG TPA: sigma factor [Vicinamibacterales bacterium]|jgi:Predicted RNA polymerase sigma factor containing a TPR repeat domain